MTEAKTLTSSELLALLGLSPIVDEILSKNPYHLVDAYSHYEPVRGLWENERKDLPPLVDFADLKQGHFLEFSLHPNDKGVCCYGLSNGSSQIETNYLPRLFFLIEKQESGFKYGFKARGWHSYYYASTNLEELVARIRRHMEFKTILSSMLEEAIAVDARFDEWYEKNKV